jgi:ribosomal protein L11
MMEARRVNKSEKRKKKRLLRKAAQLSSEDLERIAVLKRSGWETGDARSAKKGRQIGSPGSSNAESTQMIDDKTPNLQA